MPFSLEFVMNDLRKFYKIYLPFKNRYLLPQIPVNRNKKSKMPAIHIIAIMILGRSGEFLFVLQ